MIKRRWQRCGLGDDAAEDDPLRATLMAASIQSRIATGPDAASPDDGWATASTRPTRMPLPARRRAAPAKEE